MIYLDYSNTTPISLDSLDTYVRVSKEYIGSTKSNSGLGKKTQELLDSITKEISNMFNVMEREIIYTSGATESNNMALIGVALANHKKGKHIIVSKLEHPSIYEICNYLESIGFEISYVDNDEDGLIRFDDLKRLIREDTILVSICAVNSETGVRQPLKMLRQIIKKENESTLFHSDLSQAIGKSTISFRDVDLGSISSHKIYGPKGIGILYKSDLVKISPLIYGSKNNIYKPGEVPVNLVASMKEAIKFSLKDLDKRERYISLLNDRLVEKLSTIDGISINKTKYSIPHILSISFDNVNSSMLSEHLSNRDIVITTNNSNEINPSVMAIYNDLNRSKQTMRISLSHLTTVLELNNFLEAFLEEYNKLG
jgi:cysteine desulfurase